MRFQLILVCSGLFFAPAAFGESPPGLILHNGEHVISLTIRNETPLPASRLTITADGATLPSWLGVEPTSVPLPAGTDAHDVTFSLKVAGATEGAGAALVLLLADDRGRTWRVPPIDIHVGPMPPLQDTLLPNALNPFNPTTTIRYHLSGAQARPTTLTVYNAAGQRVRTLVDESQGPGVYRVRWDGRDDGGRAVASGVYLCKLVSGNFSQSQRMLLVK